MRSHHRPPKHHQLVNDNTLHVVAVVSNPIRYQSRYKLYEDFAKHMGQIPEVQLHTVETAFGDRHFEVTDANNPNHLQVRTHSEIWHKENMINLGVRHLLPADWSYMAFIDADVEFLNLDFAQETIQQLQHHPVVQMFENAIDLGPRNNVIQVHNGFANMYRTGAPGPKSSPSYPSPYWHSGYAWAVTRNWWENVGGLIDHAILGAADHHMALGMIGKASESLPGGIHPNYAKMVMEWQDRCERALQRNLGFVEGSLKHSWHGPKVKRRYNERWQILTDHSYDPAVDVSYNNHGVLELHNNKPGFKRDLQEYFRMRSEDSRDDG